jgi:hypothetical protein
MFSAAAACVGVLIYFCFGVLFWAELSFISRGMHDGLGQLSGLALIAFVAPALWLHNSRSESTYLLMALVASIVWGILGHVVRLLISYLHRASKRTNAR